ncbi:MAG: YtfJ family protein [Pseudomonadota bacterium]
MAMSPALTLGADVTLGQPLPPLAIASQGELILSDEAFSYQPWQLPEGLGKPHILQYMAGTLKARGQTKPFNDRLEAEIPYDKVHITTVINMDQILWGSSRFVMNQVKSNKERYPMATIVLDEEGLGQRVWSLPEKDAAVVIMDANGSVLWFKQGALSEEDIDETLELLHQYID